MGAYRICATCGRGLERPTAREDLITGQRCPVCNTIQPQDLTVNEWIADIDERLTEIERRLFE